MRASAPIPDVTVARDDEQERRLGVLLLDASSAALDPPLADAWVRTPAPRVDDLIA
jgi:hypothetical protein